METSNSWMKCVNISTQCFAPCDLKNSKSILVNWTPLLRIHKPLNSRLFFHFKWQGFFVTISISCQQVEHLTEPFKAPFYWHFVVRCQIKLWHCKDKTRTTEDPTVFRMYILIKCLFIPVTLAILSSNLQYINVKMFCNLDCHRYSQQTLFIRI